MKKTKLQYNILASLLIVKNLLKQLPHHYVHLVRDWQIKIYDKSIFLMSPQMMVTMFLMCILEGGRKRMSNIIFPDGDIQQNENERKKKNIEDRISYRINMRFIESEAK